MLRGLARTSKKMALSMRGMRKCVPSAWTFSWIPVSLENLIARNPASTTNRKLCYEIRLDYISIKHG